MSVASRKTSLTSQLFRHLDRTGSFGVLFEIIEKLRDQGGGIEDVNYWPPARRDHIRTNVSTKRVQYA